MTPPKPPTQNTLMPCPSENALDTLLNALCLNFPFDGKLRAYGSAFCELLEENQLAIMEETEKDSFDEEEYGKYVWSLTIDGEKRVSLSPPYAEVVEKIREVEDTLAPSWAKDQLKECVALLEKNRVGDGT